MLASWAAVLELPEPVVRTLREIVAPLVEADGGVLYVVRVAPAQAGAAQTKGNPKVGPTLRLHLAGTCAGCPGVKTTTLDVIEPALRAAGVKGDIDVSAGWIVPVGAERVNVNDGTKPQGSV